MKLKRISHIAVYGREMDRLKQIYNTLLGLDVSHEEVYDNVAELCFLPIGDTEIELVSPTSDGNPFDQELDKQGVGLNHIAFEVEDIDGAINELKEKGLLAPDVESMKGAQGSTVVFLDVDKTEGVSIELVESAR